MGNSWWFVWMGFLLLILVPPMGYGWGYRGWGPPYPSYIQRRRATQAALAGGDGSFDHFSWGWGGDFVWSVLIFGLFFVLVSFWWR